jgi:hypothetical protein
MGEIEIWKEVEGYEGAYQVSNKGHVRSLGRVIDNGRGSLTELKERILTPRFGSQGYQTVMLYKEGRKINKKVAQLVAIAFLNHKPDGYTRIVDHIDGVRNNDELHNLRVVTQRENASTCFRSDKENFSSKYVGVSWNKRIRKWESGIYVKGEQIHLGHFYCEKKASDKYQQGLNNIDNPNYFEAIKRKVTSKYNGVSWNKQMRKYKASITIKGERLYLGLFKNEFDAHLAYEKALVKL